MNRARIDVAFEAFVEARRQCGLGPAGERFFRDAWAAFRALPGSHRPTRDTMRSLRRQRPGDNRDADWCRARALHPILAFLQASRAIGPFPLPAKPPPRRVQGRPLMTEREIASLERAIADPGVQALAALVYRTGLRAERLIELQPDHVDLPDRSLHVPVGRTTRMVSLSLDAQATLRSWQAHRNSRAATLLHDPAGRPLTLKAASSVLRAAGRAQGVQHSVSATFSTPTPGCSPGRSRSSVRTFWNSAQGSPSACASCAFPTCSANPVSCDCPRPTSVPSPACLQAKTCEDPSAGHRAAQRRLRRGGAKRTRKMPFPAAQRPTPHHPSFLRKTTPHPRLDVRRATPPGGFNPAPTVEADPPSHAQQVRAAARGEVQGC